MLHMPAESSHREGTAIEVGKGPTTIKSTAMCNPAILPWGLLVSPPARVDGRFCRCSSGMPAVHEILVGLVVIGFSVEKRSNRDMIETVNRGARAG